MAVLEQPRNKRHIRVASVSPNYRWLCGACGARKEIREFPGHRGWILNGEPAMWCPGKAKATK